MRYHNKKCEQCKKSLKNTDPHLLDKFYVCLTNGCSTNYDAKRTKEDKPKLEDDYHFCDMVCLRRWLERK